jgi:hypothetical protein
MKLKSPWFPYMAAAAAVVTAIVSPAQAATITPGSVLNLSNPSVSLGGGGVRLVIGTTDANGDGRSDQQTLDFFGGQVVGGNQRIGVASGTGSFLNTNLVSQAVPPVATVLDLVQNQGAPGTYVLPSTVAGWIQGVDILNTPSNLLSGTNRVDFDLTGFTYFTATGAADITGTFRNVTTGTSIGASGSFTSQLVLTPANSSYSISLVAIPTPALLPGLAGLGLAAWRKRKEQAA